MREVNLGSPLFFCISVSVVTPMALGVTMALLHSRFLLAIVLTQTIDTKKRGAGKRGTVAKNEVLNK
jgi:hypothetical protein